MELSGFNQSHNSKNQDQTSLGEPYQNFTVVTGVLPSGGNYCELQFHTHGRSANILTFEFMQELGAFLNTTLAEEAEVLVFRSAKPGIFLAGADISMIESITQEEDAIKKAEAGKAVFGRFKALKAKTIAWLNGTCLGGGYELALFCDVIAMNKNPKYKVGLPETKLGIIPGFGGTVLLPRRIGPKSALELILKGKALTPRAAKRLNMVDVLVDEHVVPGPDVCAQMIRKHGQKRTAVSGFKLAFTPLVVYMVRKSIEPMRKNYPALSAVCEVVRQTYFLPESKAFEIENRAFAKTAITETSKNLIRVFNLSESSKKIGRVKTSQPPLATLGVIGGGVMGVGIALSAAKSGIFTRCRDLNLDVVQKSLKSAHKSSRKVWSRWAADVQRNLRLQTDPYGFDGLDCVIEAVFEDLDVKHKVFSELESVISKDCILVTNTSSLPLSEVGAKLKHPERFAGLHFFNPVLRMPLVEVIQGKQTDPEIIDRLCQFVVKLGKFPLVCQDTSGFVVNRMLGMYLNEGVQLLADGVAPARMEKLAKNFGLPMGPLRLLDEIGIDIGNHVARILFEQHGDRYAVPAGLDQMIQAGRLGRKTQKGFYTYDSKKPSLDESYCQSIAKHVARGQAPVSVTDEDIKDRLILPMLAEGCRLVNEKVVSGPEWIDVGMVFGAGFPPYKGGIMAYAKSLGVTYVEDRLHTFSERFSYAERFTFAKEREVLHML